MTFGGALCKLYSNSFLANLNSRGGWNGNDNPSQRDVGTFVASFPIEVENHSTQDTIAMVTLFPRS